MKDIELVIMAAGIGSRYGAGIKQLQKVGPQGEIIIDYSIHDALEAGFTKIIFIIRKDIEAEFKEVIGGRIEKICPVEYVYQDQSDLPAGFECPKDRTKPWGTGHAVLACREILDVPFAVINADDYYGRKAFESVFQFLNTCDPAKDEYCMAGFRIANTLSENGSVTRGICEMDMDGFLTNVAETKGIERTPSGSICCGEGRMLEEDVLVSMNMWGLTPGFIDILKEGFEAFLRDIKPGDLKAEYLLPTVIGGLLQEGKVSVKVLPTADQWFGVTYAEDRESVVKAFQKLTETGVYGAGLWVKD